MAGRPSVRSAIRGESRPRFYGKTCPAMLDFHHMGIPPSITATISAVKEEGVENAFDFPGFVPAYIRPLFCEGKGPFRWVALSGDPKISIRPDAKLKELFPDNTNLINWLDMARERIAFQAACAYLLAGPG